MKMKMQFLIVVACVGLSACVASTSIDNRSQEAKGTFAKQEGKVELPDYSHAGYQYGSVAIPDSDATIFDVTEYGAVPNDDASDFEAIERAISAAEQNGSGVVFFPAGRYLVNESATRRDGFRISVSNIVIRGSGSGPDGTVLYMKHALLPKSKKLWSTPPLFLFQKGDSARDLYDSNLIRTEGVVDIVESSQKGSFSVLVSDAAGFQAGQEVVLNSQDTSDTAELLLGQKPHVSWSVIREEGVPLIERHLIKAVEGNRLVFEEPIHVNITIGTPRKWTLYSASELGSNWGVEDLVFEGGFKETFNHHFNHAHDSGWRAVSMNGARDCWIRRTIVRDFSAGFAFSNAASCSILMNTFAGNAGHINYINEKSYGMLFGLSRDITNEGVWHGPGTASQSVGAVFWRYEGHAAPKFEKDFAHKTNVVIENHEGVREFYQWENRAGPDMHADFPHTSLWDASSSRLSGHGGYYKNLPNHLYGLTFWNHEQLGSAVKNADFWRVPDDPMLRYGSTFLVKPNLIGFHGAASTFEEDSLGIFESLGTPVSPESLYQSQLKTRLGKEPEWLLRAINDWVDLKKEHNKSLNNR